MAGAQWEAGTGEEASSAAVQPQASVPRLRPRVAFSLVLISTSHLASLWASDTSAAAAAAAAVSLADESTR